MNNNIINPDEVRWDTEVINPDEVRWNDNKQISEIMTPQTYARRSGSFLKNIGQFGGGLIGGGLGLTIGHPYIGAIAGGIAGGTAGRSLMSLLNEQINQNRLQPTDTKYDALMKLGNLTQGFNPLKTFIDMKQEERGKFAKEIRTTAISEVIAAPIGIGLNYAGKGILRGLLGARVAERGFERGFKKLLDPEFYKNRVPRMIAEKTSKFFNRLSETTGKAIDNLLKTKYKGTMILTQDLKTNINKIIPQGYTKDIYNYIDDIIPATRPKIENTILKQETKKILSMGGQKRGIYTLWNKRKELDKLINSKNWGEEAAEYLSKLRRVLNDPIRNAGDDIKEAFGKYSFVKDGEYELGKNFLVSRSPIPSPTGEIYASPAEKFAAELMQTKKDDLIRRLKDLDALANAPDKIIEDFLDYAASEAIDKKIGLGIFQEMLVGMLGGRRTIARIGAAGQTIPSTVIKKMIGRTIPVTATNIITNEND